VLKIDLKSVEVLFFEAYKTSTTDKNLHQFSELLSIGGDTLTKSGDSNLQYLH
jgi:hypothetical protein